MERSIIHADINNCFASIELLYRKELRGKPMAVGGSEDNRHGIILAKNYEAKAFGVKTAEAIWQAKQKCPQLVIVPGNYALYDEYCRRVRSVFESYTDFIEPFGMDEAWVDLTDRCGGRRASAEATAFEIKERVKRETGLTVSVGLSFNKIFAKLGSDMKKPDGLTVITPDNFHERVWPLPVGELLFVGRATGERLRSRGIRTIGDIARTDEALLEGFLGKGGPVLHAYANGLDASPVRRLGERDEVKSVGNSMTPLRDLETDDDARIMLCFLADSVARRLRASGFRCRTLKLHLRDNSLMKLERQTRLERPTCVSSELMRASLELFRASYSWARPLRSVGITGAELVPLDAPLQLAFYDDEARRERDERLERTIDSIRARYGKSSIIKLAAAEDPSLIAPPRGATVKALAAK